MLGGMDQKTIIGMILGIVAVILLILTFVMPMYTISGEMEQFGQRISFDWDFYYSETESEANGETETEEYDEDSEVGSTFNLTMIFVIVAIIGSIIGMIGALMVGLGKLDKKIGALLAIIGVIFAFVAPLYLMASLPGAFDEDGGEFDMGDEGPHESFFGSTEEEGVEISWGPGVAWYLALVAGVLNIGVIALVFLSSPAPTPQAQGGYYQQQPGQQPRQQPGQQRGWQEPQQQPGQQQPRQQPEQQRGWQEPQQQQPGQQQPRQQPEQQRGWQEPQQQPGQQPEQQPEQQRGQQQQQPAWHRSEQQQQEQQRGWEEPQQSGEQPDQAESTREQPTPGVAEETTRNCSTCGEELRYIEDYDRWYCDDCQKYD